MMNLLIIREYVSKFCCKYDKILRPAVKFLAAVIIFLSFKQLFGYQETLYRFPIILGLSFVCAFLPMSGLFVRSGMIAAVDVCTLNYEVAALLVCVYVLTYLLYLRMTPGKSWVFVLAPIYMIYLPYLLPVVVAMYVGPLGMVPAVCGIILYYVGLHIHELEPLLASASDAGKVSPMNYVIQSILSDKECLLYIMVFVVVIMVTYLIYQSSIKYAWTIAILAGNLVMVIALLGGSVFFENNLDIIDMLSRCILSCAIEMVLQFEKCVVDYSRTETVQFEDDEYYYYVKAVPKINITKKNVTVKKINVRQK